jgi:hypothetical protein
VTWHWRGNSFGFWFLIAMLTLATVLILLDLFGVFSPETF